MCTSAWFRSPIRLAASALCAVLLLITAGPARAATVSFLLDAEFSGGTAPSGPGPWLSAVFADLSPGSVRLTLSASGLSAAENVSSFYFNLDPALDPLLVNAAFNAASSGPQATQFTSGVDCCKADGDGRYDLRFTFPVGSGFNAGLQVIYDLTYAGAGLLDAPDFDFLSTPAGGHGPFKAAAHVQNTGAGGGDSGWIAPAGAPAPVPLPAPALLLGAGLLGLARLVKVCQAARRRRR